jgi:hypothetical protein
MTCEQLWYDYCARTGHPPEPQPLSKDDLTDPTLPLRLALAFVEGEAGYRPIKHSTGASIWYWRRPNSDNHWWFIPADVELAAFGALGMARHEARLRADGPASAKEVAHALRVRLGLIG